MTQRFAKSRIFLCGSLATVILLLSTPAMAGSIQWDWDHGDDHDNWLSILIEKIEAETERNPWRSRPPRWTGGGGWPWQPKDPGPTDRPTHPVPEPSGVALFAVGALVLRGAMRRR